jgi:hypothetical protein
MKQTERLSLSLFEGSDNFDFAILNENFRKLEEALKNGLGAVTDEQIKNAVAEYLRENGSATDKIIYVDVLAEKWEPHPNGTGYYQVVATEGIPALSMVTIQLTTEQVEIFTEKALTFKTENHSGELWITVVGQIPENDYVFQCKIEVVAL